MTHTPRGAAILLWTFAAMLLLIAPSATHAGGPAVAPRCILGNPNQYDRLQQVDWWDGITVYDSVNQCRRTDPTNNRHFMYFSLDDGYINNGNYPIAHVAVYYLDSGTTQFSLEYDGTNNVYQSKTFTKTNTNTWKVATFDLSDARFANREQSRFDLRLNDMGNGALYVKAVWLWCRRESTGLVTVSGNQFLTNGSRFQLVGANYMCPWPTEWGNYVQQWGANYQSATVERDLTNMEIAGVTGIRMFLLFQDSICPTENQPLDATVVSHVQDLLTRATNHGIKVIFSVGDAPSWLRNRMWQEYGGGFIYADYWTNFLYRKKFADYLVRLCTQAGLSQYDSFMAFDLMNEPTWVYWEDNAQQFYDDLAGTSDNQRQVWCSNAAMKGWNSWVNARYASLSNAYTAWGYQGPSDTTTTVYPEVLGNFTSSGAWDKKVDDYYSFIADSMVDTTNYVKNRVKAEGLARALFTIDFVSRGVANDIASDMMNVELMCNDWQRCGAACDFLDIHFYNGYSTDSSWWHDQLVYALAAGTDKPVVMAEFGLDAVSTDSTRCEMQRRTWQELMDLARCASLDGCMGWMWIDAGDPSPGTKCGIRTVADVPKPAWTEFCQRKSSFLLTTEPTPASTVEVDIDSYVSPREMFYAGGRSLVRTLVDAGSYPTVIDKYRGYPKNDTIYHLPVRTGDPSVGSCGFGAARGSVITSDTVPNFMVSGLTYDANVSVWNVGANSWSETNQYRFGTYNFNILPGRWYLNTGETIPTGGTKSFAMTLTPPSTPGTYTDTWRTVQEAVTWFGQGHDHSVVVAAMPTRGARIVSYTVPQVVAPLSTFTATVTVRNEGTATWTATSSYRLGACDDSDPFANYRQYLSGGDSIATGQTKTFTIQMTAPATPRLYRTDWMMLQEGVAWFGQKIDVEIDVE